MKRRSCSLLLALAMVWTLAACGDRAGEDTAPMTRAVTGAGEGSGFGGLLRVAVTLTADRGTIQAISVLDSGENPAIGGRAMALLSESILEHQTVSLDAVSGATLASQGFLQAAREALSAAGADMDRFSAFVGETFVQRELEADVAVVGAGAAGMTAAIAAAQAGKKVVLLEKSGITGGNSARSGGGLSAAKTQWQDASGWYAGPPDLPERLRSVTQAYPRLSSTADVVQREYARWSGDRTPSFFDSVGLFILDSMAEGEALGDQDLIATLAEGSADAIGWLDSFGAQLHGLSFFDDGLLSEGSTWRRHLPVDVTTGQALHTGSYLIPILEQTCIDNGVEILFNAPVTRILTEGGRAVGVEADGYTIRTKAVILATGGLSAAPELAVEGRPKLEGLAVSGAPGCTGDGIALAQALGADCVDLDRSLTYPTLERSTSAPIPQELRDRGAILVNSMGRRFCDETGPREAVSEALLAQSGNGGWLIADSRVAELSPSLLDQIRQGNTLQSHTPEGLAAAMGVPESTLADTIERWNACVAAGEDGAFGRTGFVLPLDTAPFYAIPVAPGLLYTTGGLRIDASAQVLDTQGDPIPGLFAAGEVTGGIHGAGIPNGNSLTDAVVFGRIAGESAAAAGE